MFNEDFVKMPPSEQNEFASVVNTLLLRGFVVRDIFDPREKLMRTNETYRYIERHFDLIADYLKFSGWNLERDAILGVVALSNFYTENRIRLDRETSLVLFALRLIYEHEKNESNSANQAIYITTPGLIKTMSDDGVVMPGKRLNGRSIAKSLRFLNNHSIISKVSGSFDEGNVSFYILPSIVYALDNDKIVAMSNALDELKKQNEAKGGLLDENLN